MGSKKRRKQGSIAGQRWRAMVWSHTAPPQRLFVVGEAKRQTSWDFLGSGRRSDHNIGTSGARAMEGAVAPTPAETMHITSVIAAWVWASPKAMTRAIGPAIPAATTSVGGKDDRGGRQSAKLQRDWKSFGSCRG
jgi:hypothetical protein